MHLTVGAVAVAVLATAIGATIQGSLGFGMNLVTVPALAIVLPDALPVTVIVLGVPMSIAMLRHERHALDRTGVGWIVAGRVPGTVAGAWVVAAVSTSLLQGIAGGIVLCLVLASIAMPPVAVRRDTQIGAGMVSGLTGTAAGIGGPPLALLYQHHPGPTMRSTLAAAFMFGTVISLITLTVAGQVALDQVLLGAGLTPLVVLGLTTGRRLHGALDRGWLRPAVLAFAALTAVLAIVHAFT